MKQPKNNTKASKNGNSAGTRPPVPFSASLIRDVMSAEFRNGAPNGEDFDRLMRYVIYEKSPDHPAYLENPLTPGELRMIEKACEERPEWKRLLSDLRDEHDTLLTRLEQSAFGAGARVSEKNAFAQRMAEFLRMLFAPPVRIPRLAGAFASVLVIGLGIMAGTSALLTPSYYSAVEVKPATFTARGGTTLLNSGIDALQRNEYADALNEFQKVISQHPNSDEALVAQYFEASVRLRSARHSLLGMFPSFDAGSVDEAISGLTDLLLRLRVAGGSRLLKEESRFMLGQAWLMKKDVARARAEFESTAAMHGVRQQESTSILGNLPSR